MAHFTALFDANVLYPAPLRDLLIQLAFTGHFRAKWSEDIHQEWINSLLQDRPDLKESDLQKTRQAMDRAVLDCLVEDYDDLVSTLTLPDPNDRHVLAAAIRGRADVIVTINIKDFSEEELSKYSISVQHPDDFVLDLLNLVPADVYAAVKKIRARLENPPLTVDQYLDNLERHGLTVSVSRLRGFEYLL